MANNLFEEIKKIMELREMGAISEGEAAEMLAIVEKQYQQKSATEINDDNTNSISETELIQPDEIPVISASPKVEIPEDKPKVFGDDDDVDNLEFVIDFDAPIEQDKARVRTEPRSSDNYDNPKTFGSDAEDAPNENKNSSYSKPVITNKFVYLVAGFGLIFICSFFTAVPTSIWDSDEDGYHTYLDDNCPEVAGVINGCPDQDKDGFPDNLDKCPTEKGFNNGCPFPPKADTTQIETPVDPSNATAPQEESDKLMLGQAVKIPKDSPLIKFTGQHWIRFNKNKNYEVSNFEVKGYQTVKSQETVDALNKYYGLKGVLKKSGTTAAPITQTPKTGQTTKPKNQTPPQPSASAEENNIEFSKESVRKTNRLTPAEDMELKNLIEKEKMTPLSALERKRKTTLLLKKG